MVAASGKARMLRCASSFVVAAYAQVRLTPQDLRALSAGLFRSRVPFKGLKALRMFFPGLDVYNWLLKKTWMQGPRNPEP